MENAGDSIIGGDLGVSGIATYQPFDGLMELKVVTVCITLVLNDIALCLIWVQLCLCLSRLLMFYFQLDLPLDLFSKF